jgi:cellulose synthase/poly-beta-1,6-N-acetylglucosamine synthase-like glycosyltransferase
MTGVGDTAEWSIPPRGADANTCTVATLMFLFLLCFYVVALSVLSLVSLNRYILVSLCRKFAHRRRESRPPLSDHETPFVTIQLPIYNEYYVAERLIRSACEVDHPRERLEVQVLDDSTDETLELTRELVRQFREEGVNITHIHRADRTGFKGGALAYGLELAQGEFVAVFDADFVIPRDFLRRTLPYFASARTGIVQARWTYLNEDYSLLTRATVIGLDAEFGIEQPARSWGGLFLGFNGTGAVLRAQCIRDAGGWHYDTITEDLDLSYRAQLAGWQIEYLCDVTCPSEIPADVHGLKAQQFRWTKGTQETAKKIIPRLLRSDISPWLKLQGTLHLLANSTYPFLLLVGILNPIVVYAAHVHNIRIAWWVSVYFLFSLFGTYSYHGEAERVLYRDWPKRMIYFPFFLGQAIGLSVNNAKAAIEAWIGRKSPFLRTPKYDLTKRGQAWHQRRYRSRFSWTSLVELTLGVYTVGAIIYSIRTREYGAIPFLVLFAFGYLLVGFYSVRHQLLSRTVPRGSLAQGEGAGLEQMPSRPAA